MKVKIFCGHIFSKKYHAAYNTLSQNITELQNKLSFQGTSKESFWAYLRALAPCELVSLVIDSPSNVP